MPSLHEPIDADHDFDRKPRLTSTSRNNSGTEPVDAGRHAITWPRLPDLVLGRDEQARRRRVIGGSDANIILGGSEEALLRLWQEKRGEAEPEDLSSRLAVVLGCWTEALNRQWYEKATGERVERVGASLCCPVHPWRGCTLDGFVERAGAVWEAKHTSGFGKAEEVLARYMPQLQHNMAVTGAERAILSVIFGNSKWEVFEIASDWLYREELLDAEARFWACVEDGTAPVAMAAPPAPRPVGVREICLEGSNAWAVAAADWLQHRHAARKHAAAVTSLKELVEDDVARAFGHGVEAKRSKAGAITIRELGS
jgi:predicted phage-related endonuclease